MELMLFSMLSLTNESGTVRHNQHKQPNSTTHDTTHDTTHSSCVTLSVSVTQRLIVCQNIRDIFLRISAKVAEYSGFLNVRAVVERFGGSGESRVRRSAESLHVRNRMRGRQSRQWPNTWRNRCMTYAKRAKQSAWKTETESLCSQYKQNIRHWIDSDSDHHFVHISHSVRLTSLQSLSRFSVRHIVWLWRELWKKFLNWSGKVRNKSSKVCDTERYGTTKRVFGVCSQSALPVHRNQPIAHPLPLPLRHRQTRQPFFLSTNFCGNL